MKELGQVIHIPVSIDIHVPGIKVSDRVGDVMKHESVHGRVDSFRRAGRTVGMKLRQPGKVTLLVAASAVAITALSISAINKPDGDMHIFLPFKDDKVPGSEEE